MFFGILLILLGVGWILQYYGYIPADFEFFWPVIFIALGLAIIFGKKKGWNCGDWWKDKDKDKDKE